MLKLPAIDSSGVFTLFAIVAGVYVANKFGDAITETIDSALLKVDSAVKSVGAPFVNAGKTISNSAPGKIISASMPARGNDATALDVAGDILVLPFNMAAELAGYISRGGTDLTSPVEIPGPITFTDGVGLPPELPASGSFNAGMTPAYPWDTP